MPLSIRPFRRLSLIYVLGFISLIALLLLGSGPAYAEWVLIGSSESHGGFSVYVDPDGIRRKGDLVKMWHLYDFKTTQLEMGNSYLSSKEQREYDCTEKRDRLLALTNFAGGMGTGDVISTLLNEQKWSPDAPGSIGLILWKAACGGSDRVVLERVGKGTTH